MSARKDAGAGLVLTGLDGSNPLAFLAALGTLRTLELAAREDEVRMRWRVEGGAWRPELASTGLSREPLVEVLHRTLCGSDDHPHLTLGKNLSVPPAQFREHASDAARSGSRRWCDFVSSFGCEVLRHSKLDRIQYTELCFVFGSGHQHYLATMAHLLQKVRLEHLDAALFQPWGYDDEGLSFRWDPIEAREHAYRWTAPGDESARTMWAANLLAAEGSAVFPTVPAGAGAVPSSGWTRRGREVVFRWPIWTGYATTDVIRSLLVHEGIAESQTRSAAALRALGVAEVFASRKVKLGEGANFKWSFTPARAVM